MAKIAPDPNGDLTDHSVAIEKKTKKEIREEAQERDDKPRKKLSGLFQFSDTEAIKEKVRNAKFTKDAYDVHNCYHETGFFQKVAKNGKFENLTLSVIVVNAVWIWIDTDHNKADLIINAEPIFVAADCMFVGYFSLELFIRFFAFKRKRDCLKDGWFCFDSTLVALYWFDPFSIGLMAYLQGGAGLDLPTAVLRLFRLARLSRLVRMLRSLPELMIMIKGMMSAACSVGYTLALLLLVTYVFAIALRNLVPKAEVFVPVEDHDFLGEAIEITYFSSVPESMHSLIIFGTFLDALSDFIIAVKMQSTPCFLLTWVYICLASLTIMNMLIGVLCEVISAVAAEEKESMIVDKVNEKFGEIVKELDTDGDGDLSWDEFEKILDFPTALRALEEVNVDPESMVDLAEDFFFEDGEPVKVTFPEFMELVLDLRGGQQATVKDVMALGKLFNKKVMKLKVAMDGIEPKIMSINDTLDQLLLLPD